MEIATPTRGRRRPLEALAEGKIPLPTAVAVVVAPAGDEMVLPADPQVEDHLIEGTGVQSRRERMMIGPAVMRIAAFGNIRRAT